MPASTYPPPSLGVAGHRTFFLVAHPAGWGTLWPRGKPKVFLSRNSSPKRMETWNWVPLREGEHSCGWTYYYNQWAKEEKGYDNGAGQRKDTASQLPPNQQEVCTIKQRTKNSSDSYLPRQNFWHLVMPNGKWKPRKQKWGWSDLGWFLSRVPSEEKKCPGWSGLGCQVEVPWPWGEQALEQPWL